MAVVGVDKEGRYSIYIPHFQIDSIESLRERVILGFDIDVEATFK